MATIPIVDWRKLNTDRDGFLADIEHAFGDIGFLCLTNAPRFEPEVQVRSSSDANIPPSLRLPHRVTRNPCADGRRTT